MSKISRKSKTRSTFSIDFDREEDGRWIAEVPALPGVMAYGSTKESVARKVRAIALRTLADKVEHGNTLPPITRLFDYDVARG